MKFRCAHLTSLRLIGHGSARPPNPPAGGLSLPCQARPLIRESLSNHAPGFVSLGGTCPQQPRIPCRNFSRSSGVICCQRSHMRRRQRPR
jgi:hypothetical protein